MDKTLRNIVLGTALALNMGCGGDAPQPTRPIPANAALNLADGPALRRGLEIPVPKNNQQLLLNPRYITREFTVGYTLLTDIDQDGRWDLAEEVQAGRSYGHYFHSVFVREGFKSDSKHTGVAQARYLGLKIKEVPDAAFLPYHGFNEGMGIYK